MSVRLQIWDFPQEKKSQSLPWSIELYQDDLFHLKILGEGGSANNCDTKIWNYIKSGIIVNDRHYEKFHKNI